MSLPWKKFVCWNCVTQVEQYRDSERSCPDCGYGPVESFPGSTTKVTPPEARARVGTFPFLNGGRP